MYFLAALLCSGLFLPVNFCVHSVGRPVRLLVTSIRTGKMADLMKMPFGMSSGVDPRNSVLDGCAHWCQKGKYGSVIVSTIGESAIRGGNTACSQIIWTVFLY